MKKLILKIINRLKRGVWVNLDIIDNEFRENMKKLLLLALTAVVMTGCQTKTYRIKTDLPDYIKIDSFCIMELDSCEYVCAKGYVGYVHKGNCRFCTERRKQELKEMIKELK